MFSICRQSHPATGIEHTVSCCFFNSDEKCVVTAGANILKVFRLIPDTDSKEKLTDGTPPKMKLECLANFTLWGCVMCLQSVAVAGAGRDLLLLSFPDAKLAVVQYDPATHGLATLSLHYFEEDDMKGGWTSHNNIPIIRVDPENRCFVMLLYGRRLAVIPLRKEANTEDGDISESKPLDTKTPQLVSAKAPVMASYVIVLKDLDPKIDNIIDLQFLHGYYEPTLLMLYEPVKTFPGRTAVRLDTCAMIGVSLNLQARVNPVIWAVAGLPFDCVSAVAIQRPLGGCLILAVNSIIYLNQSIPPYGVSLNSMANHSTNFPLKIQEGVCLSLEGVCVSTLAPQKLVLSLRSGQLYLLTLLADSVRSIRAFHLDKAAASVLTTCMCICEDSFMFLGSRLGNSLLLRFTEKERHTLLQVERPTATIDLTTEELGSGAKKRRLESLSDCMATDVQEIRDKDELEVYGSDRRTSTELTTYMFEVCDSLLNIGPIGGVSMGEPAFQETGASGGVELVTTSGYGKNGALCVLRRSVRPQIVTTFHLPGCNDMWTVLGELPGQSEANKDNPSEEGTHSYMLLSQEDSTMVLQTGHEINEVDNSGFITQAPTIFAGNLGNNKYIIQVTTLAIRLIKGSQQIQNITLDNGAVEAHSSDPYLCVMCGGGRLLVLALREGRGQGGTARLAALRHHPPATPHAHSATLYRDLSGLFSTAPVPEHHSQIKGENPVKKGMKGGNVKREGAMDPNVIHDVDEDDLLYGGNQTPASMVSLIQTERVLRETTTGNVRRDWWRRHFIEHKPSYWLFIVRVNGNMEIYSLPDMKLSFLVRDITSGQRVLTDSLESVPFLMGQGNPEDLLAEIPEGSRPDRLKEILVVGLGNKGSRPLLFLRMDNELMIYQVFQYAKGNLKMRFKRMPLGIPRTPEKDVVTHNEDESFKHNVKKLRYFSNIAGYNGVFVCGRPGLWVLLPPRGELRCHPHSASLPDSSSHVALFAPFNNVNCSQGFLYFNIQSELKICMLPTHLSYDAPWPVRKVPLRSSPHSVTYHLESRTYCIVTSTAQAEHSYYRFNGEDKELSNENKGDRFPYPLQDRFSVMLFSPVSWEIIPNTKIELEEWEHVTCLKNVNLAHEGTRTGLRGYIVLGTNYNYGEDITSRGRILIYDVIEVVPEPGQPLTKNRFKEIYAKEQKGPVTALAQVSGFLVSAVGQKIYIWQLKDNDLVGVAFIDTQVYVHRILAVKSMLLAADVYRSVALMRFQEHHRTLSLAARDMRTVQVYDMEFLIDNTNLGFLVSESEGNFVMFNYQPEARESLGGQRLIRKADYHLGQKVNCMFRIACRPLDEEATTQNNTSLQLYSKEKRHCTMFATLDGGLGYVLPVSEKVYRRLLMLQNVMNNYCCHLAGLNPKAYRTYKSSKKLSGGPARGILDGDLVSMYLYLPENEKAELAKKIGAKEEEIFADLVEIENLTAHF